MLEQTLQQVLEQPLTHSSPTTSQKSQKSDDDKNSNKEQVQLLAGCALAWLLCGASPACKLSVSGNILALITCMYPLCWFPLRLKA